VVVSLGVDGGHDDIRYETGLSCRGDVELLGRAIDSLTAARDALSRVRDA
jgi:hypothetical protein